MKKCSKKSIIPLETLIFSKKNRQKIGISYIQMLISCLERNICEMRLSSVDSLVNGEDFLFNAYVAYIAFSDTILGFSEGSRSHFCLDLGVLHRFGGFIFETKIILPH